MIQSDSGSNSRPWRPDQSVESAFNSIIDDTEVIILPTEITDDGVGVYRESQLLVVKELRERGVRANFLNDSAHRTFKSEYSSQVLAELAFGVLGNLSWDAIRATAEYVGIWASSLASKPDDRIRVSVAKIGRADGTLVEGLSIDVPTDEAAAVVLDKLKDLVNPESEG